jgi:hypothetical protein
MSSSVSHGQLSARAPMKSRAPSVSAAAEFEVDARRWSCSRFSELLYAVILLSRDRLCGTTTSRVGCPHRHVKCYMDLRLLGWLCAQATVCGSIEPQLRPLSEPNRSRSEVTQDGRSRS